MKIAVFRALQLGDMLCAVPALRALRAAWPQAEIALVGLPWAREFAARFSRYVERFIEFPGFPGLPERAAELGALPRFFGTCHAQKFDLALQVHGSGELTNPLTVLMGARRNAGFFRPGRYCPERSSFLEWREREHEVLRLLRLAERVGAPAKGTYLEFPLTEADWAEWRALRLEGYACIHPGSQLPSRRWPPERFAEVADALAMEGYRIVLTGAARESGLTEKVASLMREPALDLAGRTSLGGLAALIGRARLLVANDTGVSHIASAMRTPSVIVSCGSDPARWAPLDHRLHRVLHHDVDCRPCNYADCPVGHPCAWGVGVQEVLKEIRDLAQCAA